MEKSGSLTPELIALVHHIELNKAGWWNAAIQRLLLTAFYIRSDTVTMNVCEIRETLRERYSIALEDDAIGAQLADMVACGEVLEPARERFKISEAALRRCEVDIEVSTALEAEVRKRFDELLVQHCPMIEGGVAWSSFNEKFLAPLVQQLGASTYELLSGTRSFDELRQIDEFVNSFTPDLAVSLNRFLREFLDPANVSLRRFVLRTMTAFFVVQAGGLTDRIIKRLEERAHPFSATLFLDSNVLFSLLGLHENPADESSRNLLRLVQRLSSSTPIKLRVLPPTLDEMRRAIKASQEAVLEMRVSSKLLKPAIEAGITGITAKFLTLAAATGATIAPADYFEPYLKNLLTILGDNGVSLFNQNLSSYRTRQDVMDDLMEQLDREKQRYGPYAKNYERLEHDMILWHFANDKRPPRPESPIDAEFWVVTADFRLLGFDAYKRRKTTNEIPICLHPVALVQLLQFWIPMDSELEIALFSAIRLPTVLAPFDSQAEKISLRILNALSTFENIGDMPAETTTRILLNDALRQKLALEKDLAKEIELVKEALVEENRKAEERFQAESIRKMEAQQQSRALEEQLAQSRESEVQLRQSLDIALTRERSAKEETQRLVQREEERAAAETLSRVRSKSRLSFAAKYLGALAVCVTPYIILRKTVAYHIGLALAEIAVLATWAVLFGWRGSKQEHVKGWAPFRLVMRFKIWLALAILGGIVGNAAWHQVEKETGGDAKGKVSNSINQPKK